MRKVTVFSQESNVTLNPSGFQSQVFFSLSVPDSICMCVHACAVAVV